LDDSLKNSKKNDESLITSQRNDDFIGSQNNLKIGYNSSFHTLRHSNAKKSLILSNTSLNNISTKEKNTSPRSFPEYVLLLITIPSLQITKLIKAYFSETPVAIVNRIRKKPGISLEDNTNYICWIIRKGHEPIMMENDQLISSFNFKEHETLLLLKDNEKYEDVNTETYHEEKKERKSKIKKTVSKREKKKVQSRNNDD